MEELKIRASKVHISLGMNKIQLFAYQQRNGGFYSAQKLELIQQEPNNCLSPFLTINSQEAQILIDDLWDCGLRPSEGSGSTGSFAAQQRHLDDMRRLVFKDFSDSQMRLK